MRNIRRVVLCFYHARQVLSNRRRSSTLAAVKPFQRGFGIAQLGIQGERLPVFRESLGSAPPTFEDHSGVVVCPCVVWIELQRRLKLVLRLGSVATPEVQVAEGIMRQGIA